MASSRSLIIDELGPISRTELLLAFPWSSTQTGPAGVLLEWPTRTATRKRVPPRRRPAVQQRAQPGLLPHGWGGAAGDDHAAWADAGVA